MMVKNQTAADVHTGGQTVPPDGDYHQVKDTPGTRELIKAGALSEQRKSGGSDKGGSS